MFWSLAQVIEQNAESKARTMIKPKWTGLRLGSREPLRKDQCNLHCSGRQWGQLPNMWKDARKEEYNKQHLKILEKRPRWMKLKCKPRQYVNIREKKYPIGSTGKHQNVYEACKISVWPYSDHICQRRGSAMTQNWHGLGERVNILQISYRFTCFIFSCWNRKGEEKSLLILSRFIPTENTHLKFYLNFGFMQHLSLKSRWKNWRA